MKPHLPLLLAALAMSANAQVPDAPSCGGEQCGAGTFCEWRYKGHALDDEHRPLKHSACQPLPAECVKTPSCACLTKHVQVTSCKVDHHVLFTTDEPQPSKSPDVERARERRTHKTP